MRIFIYTSLISLVLTSTITLSATNSSFGDECRVFTGGTYGDFNTNFGGAPCDEEGVGCPTLSTGDLDFQVYASEAYTINYFKAGSTYTWSQCDGPGARAWVPEFTIIAPSGTVDAFGLGDGDGCSITWTATESGTYLIGINEAGNCGTGDHLGTPNGNGKLTCATGVVTPCEPCVAPRMNSNTQYLCTGESFSLTIDPDGTTPAFGGVGYFFRKSDNTAAFVIVPDTLIDSFDAVLNGEIISTTDAALTAPLTGTWIVRPFTFLNRHEDAEIVPLVAGITACSVSADSTLIVFSDVDAVTRQDIIVDNNSGTATILFNGNSTTVPPGFTLTWEGAASTDGVTATYNVAGDYTLTVSDANGCKAIREFTMEVSTNIDLIVGLKNFQVQPNPAKDHFTVRLELAETQRIEMDLVNVVGQEIRTISTENSRGGQYFVDVADLETGIYLLRVHVGSTFFTEKILISK